MRKILAAAVLFALAGTCIHAQARPEVRVSLFSHGGSAAAALEALAQTLNYSLRYGEEYEGAEEFEFHVWLRIKDAAPQRAARVLSQACGVHVRLDDAGRAVRVSSSPESRRVNAQVKGYDVSLAASRQVAYQNQWGAPRAATIDRLPGLAEHPAAEQLAELVQTLLEDHDRPGPSFAVAGDRLLLRDSPEMHGRVRELLDLLVNDNGGTSVEARNESAVLQALRRGKPPLLLSDSPRTGVLAQICEAAGVDFFVRPESVAWLEEDHVSLELAAEQSARDALDLTFTEDNGAWRVLDGAVAVGVDGFAPPGYRVFEAGELLKRLDAALQRQRTDPDRARGFSGDLRSQGGMDVVVNAVLHMLGDETESGSVMVESWGSRLIVRGGSADLDLAETALKEMGWEPPKGN